jgi:hypothetical protein
MSLVMSQPSDYCTYEYIYSELQELMCLLLNNLLAHDIQYVVHALYYSRKKDTGGQHYRVCIFIDEGITVYVHC